LCFLLYFKHFEIERLYSVKHLYPVNLCESPRTTFITVEQGRGKAAAVYHILHSPSPTRHYEINASVTMKNILMWSRKQQISDSRNMKTDCIKNIQLETQILLSRHINKLQLDECRSSPHRP